MEGEEGMKKAEFQRMFKKESREHPTLPKSVVKRIVLDHASKKKH